MTISLCMIVKNEEAVLARCLDSVQKFIDEIIIVDTGSTDDTKSIAARYTDLVYDYVWRDDFSAARNYSFSKASMDYIMWLDADDIIKDEEIDKIIELKKNLPLEIDVVLMKYALEFDEYNHVTQAFYRERIIKRSNHFKWVGSIHEYLEVEGNLLQTDICIIHSPARMKPSDRNLKMLERLISTGCKVSSRELYYYAAELFNNGQHEKALEYYAAFLNSDDPAPMYVTDVCLHAAAYYMIRNQPAEALKILIKSMEFGIMRPEILCLIGNIYKEIQDYRRAISWYELIFVMLIPAFDLEMHSYELGGFIPCIDLCHCYCQLGEYSQAIKYNELAARYKPDDPIVEYNREKFREAGLI